MQHQAPAVTLSRTLNRLASMRDSLDVVMDSVVSAMNMLKDETSDDEPQPTSKSPNEAKERPDGLGEPGHFVGY